MTEKQEIWIDYTNWRGERRIRRVRPQKLSFTSNEWHSETQWMLFAFDLEADDEPVKTFTMADIHRWSPTRITAV